MCKGWGQTRLGLVSRPSRHMTHTRRASLSADDDGANGTAWNKINIGTEAVNTQVTGNIITVYLLQKVLTSVKCLIYYWYRFIIIIIITIFVYYYAYGIAVDSISIIISVTHPF